MKILSRKSCRGFLGILTFKSFDDIIFLHKNIQKFKAPAADCAVSPKIQGAFFVNLNGLAGIIETIIGLASSIDFNDILRAALDYLGGLFG